LQSKAKCEEIHKLKSEVKELEDFYDMNSMEIERLNNVLLEKEENILKRKRNYLVGENTILEKIEQTGNSIKCFDVVSKEKISTLILNIRSASKQRMLYQMDIGLIRSKLEYIRSKVKNLAKIRDQLNAIFAEGVDIESSNQNSLNIAFQLGKVVLNRNISLIA
jgi:hypothetical protein